MRDRQKAMAKACKKRGGSCPCVSGCKAIESINVSLSLLNCKAVEIKREIDELCRARSRLNTKPATLKDGFEFRDCARPVMYFDGDEAHFGYEDESGEFTNEDEWPFNEESIFYDDCERFGIDVER